MSVGDLRSGPALWRHVWLPLICSFATLSDTHRFFQDFDNNALYSGTALRRARGMRDPDVRLRRRHVALRWEEDDTRRCGELESVGGSG